MRIIILPFVCVVAFAACNKKVVSPTTTKEGEGAVAAATSDQPILYHGMKIRPTDLLVLNDRVPVYGDLPGGPGSGEVLVADAGTPATSTTDGSGEAAFALQGGESAYMRRCRDAGIKIPPAWTGDESTGWTKKGEVTDVFISKSATKTILWSYVDAEETTQCAALPRYNGDNIELFGLICASLTTGQTCFWDNVDPVTKGPVAVTKGYTVASGSGADILGENCSQCHRGDNPWIVNPDQPTAELRRPKARYAPIGTAKWVNPVPANPVKGCSVARCHNMPELTAAYCQIGTDFIDSGVMPYEGGTDGVVEFKTACQKVVAAENAALKQAGFGGSGDSGDGDSGGVEP